jgi:hypothetical protein
MPIKERVRSKGYMRYQLRGRKSKKNQYGIFCRSYWQDGKKKSAEIWLGTVVNKDESIFKSRERGVFKFIPPNTFEPMPEFHDDYRKILDTQPLEKASNERAASVAFGSIYAIAKCLSLSGLFGIFTAPFDSLGNAMLALILFKITKGGASAHVNSWLQNTYARYLFPDLNLKSQRISEILKKVGNELCWTNFFSEYTEFVKSKAGLVSLLVDSTGLPNDINTCLTKRNNHGGVVSNEIRMIVALEQSTGYPLYFKYVPGNVVDKVTLKNVIEELESYNIDVHNTILDAGYYSNENISVLNAHNIGFITRMVPNRREYKDLRDNQSSDIEDMKYLVACNGRRLFVKHLLTEIDGIRFHAYACVDIKDRQIKQNHLYSKYNPDKPDKDIEEKRRTCGFFVILSSRDISSSDILPLYYKRQAVEQFFDYAKNDLDLLPLACHSEETVRGHLMVCFMASVAHTYLAQALKESAFSVTSALVELDTYNAQVRPDRIVPDVIRPAVRKVFAAFGLEIPDKININEAMIN